MLETEIENSDSVGQIRRWEPSDSKFFVKRDIDSYSTDELNQRATVK